MFSDVGWCSCNVILITLYNPPFMMIKKIQIARSCCTTSDYAKNIAPNVVLHVHLCRTLPKSYLHIPIWSMFGTGSEIFGPISYVCGRTLPTYAFCLSILSHFLLVGKQQRCNHLSGLTEPLPGPVAHYLANQYQGLEVHATERVWLAVRVSR